MVCELELECMCTMRSQFDPDMTTKRFFFLIDSDNLAWYIYISTVRVASTTVPST